MKRNLYIYTTRNRKLIDIPEFGNSIGGDLEIFDISKDYVYVDLDDTTFNNEFIQNDIESKRDNSYLMYIVMKESNLEVRNLDFSFEEFFEAPYKTVKNLIQSYSSGRLDHDYWVTHRLENDMPFDDHLN